MAGNLLSKRLSGSAGFTLLAALLTTALAAANGWADDEPDQGAGAGIAIEAAPSAPASTAVYTVCYDNAHAIGTHTVKARDEAGGRIVETLVEIAAPLGLWEFTSRQTETWRGDRLVAFRSLTNDDGEPHDISAAADGGALIMDGHDHRTRLPGKAVPENYWHRWWTARAGDGVFGGAVAAFETKKGRPLELRVSADGADTLIIGGQPMPAQRFQVSGGAKRTLWYGQDGALLRMDFVNRGYPVTLTLGTCGEGKPG